jgi:hypothetical protein
MHVIPSKKLDKVLAILKVFQNLIYTILRELKAGEKYSGERKK